MATCPQCGQFLGESHRCQGVWRLKARAWSLMLGRGAAGVVLAAVATLATHSDFSLLPVALCAVTGGIVGSAYVRGEPR